jgi:hypothetical protein
MKRHNGIEWDDDGRWVDHTETEARIAELEAQRDESERGRQDVVYALATVNGMLDEVDRWLKIRNSVVRIPPPPTFGDLADILAKRKGGG